jgi:hypothetical protein
MFTPLCDLCALLRLFPFRLAKPRCSSDLFAPFVPFRGYSRLSLARLG